MSAAVFETIRVRAGRAPLLPRHEARLAAACGALGLPRPEPSLADAVAAQAGMRDGVVRVEVSATGTAVTTRDLPSLLPLAVRVASTPHAPYPHKVTSRPAFEAALAEARVAGGEGDDALLITPGGLVAEGTAWNIFWWEADGPATPPLSLGVLPGVARGRVMELVPTKERERAPGDLVGRGLFATNAIRGVVPIERLNGAPVPPDSRTTQLADRFWPE
jgi:branched-subunit amino acid aminotransferase/4-amino-4-deoxychorismate lyase